MFTLQLIFNLTSGFISTICSCFEKGCPIGVKAYTTMAKGIMGIGEARERRSSTNTCTHVFSVPSR